MTVRVPGGSACGCRPWLIPGPHAWRGASLNNSATGIRESSAPALPASHLLVLLAITGLRILFVLAVGLPYMTPGYLSWPMDDDSHQYVRYAIDLMDGHQEEAAVRMPLYPILLALTWSDGTPWLLTVVLQQAMGLAIGILCWKIAASFSRRAALPAGLAAMLLPQHILFSTRIMPDTLALLAVVWSGYVWIRTLRAGSSRSLVTAYCAIGLILSFGAMTKQVLLYSPVVYGALLLAGRRPVPGVKLLALSGMVAVFLAMPLGWRAFNRSAFGLDAYSTQDALEPLGRVAVLAGLTDQEAAWRGEFTAPLDSLAMVDGRVEPGARDSIYRARTREIVLAAPVRILVPHLISWPRFFNIGYAHLILRSMRIDEAGFPLLAWKLVLLVIYLVLAAGTATALLAGRVRRRMKPLLHLLAGWSVFSVLIYGPLATTRYGLTFYWALIVTSATAFAILSETGSRESEPEPDDVPGGGRTHPPPATDQ